MLDIAVTVIPVFALIALGYGAARLKFFSPEAETGLSRFVLYFAVPALLFRTMVSVDVASPPWLLWLAYFAPLAVVWTAATLVSRRLASIRPAAGASAAMASVYGNIVLLGLPLCISFLGPAAAVPAGLIIAINSPLLWTLGTLQAEIGRTRAGAAISHVLQRIAGDLLRNPIVMAILAGLLWGMTGLGLNPVVDRTIGLLGQAGIPASLFALGLSLVAFGFRGNIRGVTVILVLKMLVYPLLAGVLALKVIGLTPVEAGVVIIFASVPPGVNAYLFASKYEAAAAPVAGTVAIGTALAMFTSAAILWVLNPV